MILVFGGTTEGKQVASFLDEACIPYYYSTKTKVSFKGKGIPINGALTKHELEQFCIANNIKCIVNASHPFAEILHDTVASIENDIPIIRFEREFTARVKHKLVTYTNSYEESLCEFNKRQYKSILALSGVQTITRLKSYWENNKSWFRILDRDVSRSIAKKANYPSSQLLFGYPQNVEEEINLYKELKPDIIFTKESGVNGKLDQKISAALKTHIPIVILKKPLVSNRYLCINSIEELNQTIIAYIE
ncbi:precorrin-6A/cobalt-precorrin-6A reductase [Tenacibaculum sp. SZ-18]|uniref:precorrin-6A/cobalt-precorrin-6A reductase n=1 Tax=Tenacibaculum sp. SZ-18 TaxID=754423 RepID=UPI000C2D67B9|nr:precorrin-6A/cobalt-precorrin-6A reductase [Tenacibaculum sp. SZ-18]